MIGALLAVALAAHPARVFLSVDRPFLPDEPGSLLRVEMEGGHTLDLRLYQLHDPERFLIHDGMAGSERVPRDAPRAPSPTAVLAGRAAALRHGLRNNLLEVLSPEAVGAVRLLAPGALVEPGHEVPFLQGEQLLRRWDLPCGGAESHSYCDVDLGTLPSGVYLAEGVSGRESAYAVVVVSGLALAARQLPGQVLVYAVDARTGEPRPGAQISLFGTGGALLTRGATGPQGTFSAKLTQRQVTVVGKLGSDLALLDLDFFDARAHGTRVWVTTDRGEVRPGETLHYGGLQRPNPGQVRDLVVSLEDGRGTPIAHGLAHQDAQGVFAGEIAVPSLLAPGVGHLVVQADGRDFVGEVNLDDPPTPDLVATARLSTDGASAEIELRDQSGHPVAGSLDWRWVRSPLAAAPPSIDLPSISAEELGSGTEKVDDTGRLHLALPPGARDARFTLDVVGVDAWGHRATAEDARVLLQGPVHVSLATDRRIYTPGDFARVSLSTTDADGKPAAARLNLRFTATAFEAGATGAGFPEGRGPSEPSTATVLTQDLTVPASGQAEVVLPHLTPGYYELVALLGTQRVASSVVFVTDRGGDIPFTPDELTLIPDRAAYAPGDTARVLIFAPFESATALVTLETGEILKQDLASIQRSSALVNVKIPGGAVSTSGLALSVTAFTGGQAFQRTRMLRTQVSDALSLALSTAPDPRTGGLEVRVTALDRLGKPVPNVDALLLWRDRAALPSLAPPLSAFLFPRGGPEGRESLSLDYRSSGYSEGSVSERLEQARAELAPTEGFTPQKGLPRTPSRAGHALAAGALRLPPTDRAGASRGVIDPANASELALEVFGIAPGGLDLVGTVASAAAVAPSPWPSVAPTLPAVVRPGDRARASVRVTAPGPADVTINGASLHVVAGSPIDDSIPLEGPEARLDVRDGARALLEQAAATAPGSDWSPVASGTLRPGTPTRFGAGREQTQRWLITSGPLGELHRQLEALRTAPRSTGFEQVHVPGADPGHRTDAACHRLAVDLALQKVGEDPREVGPAVAALVALTSPDGSLGAFPGGPFDRHLTALSLWLLEQAQQLGAEVPLEWKDRIHARLETDAARAEGRTPETALALLGAGDEWQAWMEAMTEDEEHLAPEAQAFLVLALSQASDPRARAAALRLERRGTSQAQRACWGAGGCNPAARAEAASLAATAAAVVALAQVLPPSHRIGEGLRFLLQAPPDGGPRGESAGLLPLALAAAHRSVPDKAGRAQLVDGEGHRSRAEVPRGGSAVLYGTGPSQLRVEGAPMTYEVAQAHSEPTDSGGDLDVERHWYIADAAHAARGAALSGKVPLGTLIWVDISVEGAAPGAPVMIDDRFPAGLSPIEQPAARGPAEALLAAGGDIAFASDRVRLQVVAGKDPIHVGYLARAILPGSYRAPPCRAESPQAWGRSDQDRLVVGEAP